MTIVLLIIPESAAMAANKQYTWVNQLWNFCLGGVVLNIHSQLTLLPQSLQSQGRFHMVANFATLLNHIARSMRKAVGEAIWRFQKRKALYLQAFCWVQHRRSAWTETTALSPSRHKPYMNIGTYIYFNLPG